LIVAPEQPGTSTQGCRTSGKPLLVCVSLDFPGGLGDSWQGGLLM